MWMDGLAMVVGTHKKFLLWITFPGLAVDAFVLLCTLTLIHIGHVYSDTDTSIQTGITIAGIYKNHGRGSEGVANQGEGRRQGVRIQGWGSRQKPNKEQKREQSLKNCRMEECKITKQDQRSERSKVQRNRNWKILYFWGIFILLEATIAFCFSNLTFTPWGTLKLLKPSRFCNFDFSLLFH